MKLAMIGLILSVLVVMQYGMASTSVSRIRKRLNVLETKMSLDAIEFREEIEKLSSSLTNQTCGCSGEGTGAVSPTVEAPERDTDVKGITQLVKGFRRGFYNEKKFIRHTLSEMSDKMKGDIKACEEANSDTLRTTQSKLDGVEQRLNEKLKNLEDKLSYVEDEVKQQHANIEKNINARDEMKQQIEGIAMSLRRMKDPASEGWKQHGNSIYKLVDKKATWQEAVDSCALMDSYLVEIGDQPEQDFVASIMIENDKWRMWLGGSDIKIEGNWIWNHSGKLVGQDNELWQEGRPYSDRSYNCLTNSFFSDYKWYDEPCSWKRAYLCETNIG